jgi:excinuclease ABC subunit C
MSDSEQLPEPAGATPAEKAKQFPPSPGVYLMKDAQGRVIYIGKAKNLRNRASHYFTKIAAEDMRTADLVKVIADIDFVQAETEVDALLMEARLVKDIQPRFNIDLKDDKTFPYLQIRMREEFPRVEFTRAPKRRGVRSCSAFFSSELVRSIFNPRTCVGAGFARVCCTAFDSAQPPVICG